jgi:predicted nucleic acid-binding protein
MAVLVDTNVLLDILTHDPVWETWSLAAFQAEIAKAPVIVNAIICAELSPAFAHDWSAMSAWLAPAIFIQEDWPFAASTRAALAFEHYKRRGGTKQTLLADFFIGAHAEQEGHTLLTRDAQRYRTYFPGVALLCP